MRLYWQKQDCIFFLMKENNIAHSINVPISNPFLLKIVPLPSKISLKMSTNYHTTPTSTNGTVHGAQIQSFKFCDD